MYVCTYLENFSIIVIKSQIIIILMYALRILISYIAIPWLVVSFAIFQPLPYQELIVNLHISALKSSDK